MKPPENAEDPTDEPEDRALARSLFARDDKIEDDPPPPDTRPAGYVAREGNSPTPAPPDDARQFVRDLFA